MVTNVRPEWSDMQGLIVSPYTHLDAAAYLLLRIDDAEAARRWLSRMVDHVTPAFKLGRDANVGLTRRLGLEMVLNLNIALTYTGLTKLCHVDDRDRDSFLYAFTEGIAGKVDRNVHRSRILGDTGPNDPARWEWGYQNPVDVLLMVFAENEDARDLAVDTALKSSGMVSVLEQPPLVALSLKQAARKEHFGFVDGLSQPILRGTAEAERYPDSSHLTEIGEFVFGYPDGENTIADGPKLGGCNTFGTNGTYLVFRQLEQDVRGFWDFVNNKTRSCGGIDDPIAARQLASKIVGRQQDGTPLVAYGHRDDNEFDFSDDPHGYGCPVGAHIRRANPRGSLSAETLPRDRANRHRLLRRSRSYGTKLEYPHRDDEKRGLLFLVLNSDFERQFEFISQNWINNSGFSGLQGERDPLVGRDDARRFTIPGLPARTHIDGLPHFITVKGGEYFFLPGITALKYLAGVKP